MKKIISFLLLVAMVVGCMIPAVITSAAAATLSVATVDKMEGTGTQVSPELKIAGNPGISNFTFVVAYEKAKFGISDADPFDGSIFSADDSAVSNVGNAQVKNYIPTGASAADYAAKTIDCYTAYDYDADVNPDTTADGIIAKLPLELLNPVTGTSYNYYITVTGAYNAAGEEVEVTPTTITGTVNYVADPLIGIKDDFTLFFDPATKDVNVGETTLSVDLRMDKNPGIWSIRCYIVYPEELTLVGTDGAAGTNGTVFADNSFSPGLINHPLNDENQIPAFEKYLANNPSIQKEGYVSSTFAWLPDDPLAVIEGNGHLMTLDFVLPADAKAGDTYDIAVYTGDGDVFWAGTADDGVTPIFKDYTPAFEKSIINVVCEHTSTEDQHLDATCGTDGYNRTVCTACGEVLNSEVIPATGVHTPGEAVEVPSTCVQQGTSTVSCTVCNEVLSTETLDLAAHTPGEAVEVPATCTEAGSKTVSCTVCNEVLSTETIDILPHTPGAEATCTTAQTCTVCGTELAAALGHTPGAPDVTKPTCTEDGVSVTSCTVCGEELSRETLAANGHVYLQPNNTRIVPATCTEQGYTEKTCDVCGDKLITEYTDPLGHTADDPIVVPATYYADGSSKTYCYDCNELLDETVLPRLTVYVTVSIVDEEGNELVSDESPCYVGETYIYLDILADMIPGYTFVVPEGATVIDDAELGKAMLLELEETETADFTFTATANTDIVYTVYYVDAEGNELAEAKVVEGQTMATDVTEQAIEIEGYTADEAEITITLAATDNEIVFTYTAVEAEDDEDKDVPGDSDKPAEPTKPGSAQTGDNVMYIVIALAVVAIASCAVIVIRRKRSSN